MGALVCACSAAGQSTAHVATNHTNWFGCSHAAAVAAAVVAATAAAVFAAGSAVARLQRQHVALEVPRCMMPAPHSSVRKSIPAISADGFPSASAAAAAAAAAAL